MATMPPIHGSNLEPGLSDEFLGLLDLGGGVKKTVRSTADQVAQRLLAEGPLKTRLEDVASSAARPNWRPPVRVVITADVALNALVEGAVFDGVTLLAGDRVLLAGQANAAQNGIYIVVASGTAARAPDADAPAELAGMVTFVLEGTVGRGKQYGTTAYSITVGSTPLPFVETLDMSVLNADIDALGDKQADMVRASQRYLLPQTGFEGLISDDWDTILRKDRKGNVALGLDRNLNLRARMLDEPGIPCLDFHRLVINEHGQLVEGFDFDWQRVSGTELTDVDAIVRSEGGTTRVYAVKGDIIAPLTFGERDLFGARLRGHTIAWVEDDGGTLVQRYEEVVAASSLLGSVSHNVLLAVYGQSLGNGSLSTPALSTAPVLPGHAGMLNGGAAPRGVIDPNDPLPPENIAAIIDLHESGRETPASQMAVEVAAGLDSHEAVTAAVYARGGTGYLDLKKGTGPYANIVTGVRRQVIINGLNGQTSELPALSFIHGENDHAASLATYIGYLRELQADLKADLAPYVDTSAFMLAVDQISNWTKLGLKPATSDVPLAQLQVALDYPDDFICVCPKYMLLTVVDGVHLINLSTALLGAYHGRAIRWLRAGLGWQPTHATSAVRSGASIVLDFHTPDGDLVLDTVNVTDPGNYGVEFFQTGGAAVTISSVTKTGAQQLTVTLSGVPSGTDQRIGIARTGVSDASAGPTSGPRSCIRDSSPDLDSYGQAMWNWACHQLINVTV